MEYQIDFAPIETSKEFHRQLADILPLPNWYGHNLDALYDCLTELGTPIRLIIQNWNDRLPFADGFRGVFLDAQKDNPNFSIVFQ